MVKMDDKQLNEIAKFLSDDDEIMKNNIKLIEETTQFDKDYYRNKYVEAINKIATMTSKRVDLQQQLLEKQDELLKAHVIIQHLTEDVDVIDLMKRVQEVKKQREQDRLEDQAM